MGIEDEIALIRKKGTASVSLPDVPGVAAQPAPGAQRVASHAAGPQVRTIEEEIAAQRKTHITGVRPSEMAVLMEGLGETDPSKVEKRINRLVQKRIGWVPQVLFAMGLLISLVLLLGAGWVGLLSFAMVIGICVPIAQKHRKQVIRELVSGELHGGRRGSDAGRFQPTTIHPEHAHLDAAECTSRIEARGCMVLHRMGMIWEIRSADKKSLHIALTIDELRAVLSEIESESPSVVTD